MNFSKLNRVLEWNRRVGTLFGIPIHLHITILFFLLPALSQQAGIGFALAVEFAVGIVFSILIHELGHALTAKHFRQSNLKIMLHGFGGFAFSQGNRTPKQELLIVLAGPCATFALGLLGLATANIFGHGVRENQSLLIQLGLIHALGAFNIFLGVINLIPILPWDGGQAVVAILSFRMPEIKALRFVAHYSLICGPLLAVYGFIRHGDFLIIFGLMGGISSYVTLQSTGGVKFGEAGKERKAKKEEEAYRKRRQEKNDAYLDEVSARAREREEQERLRKLLE